jgi:hypothetical protein
MFVDVIEDGLTFQAGIRPGELLWTRKTVPQSLRTKFVTAADVRYGLLRTELEKDKKWSHSAF